MQLFREGKMNPLSLMSGDGQFPAGLRVLVVDDDPTCLRILEKMLKNCLYQVTSCNRAEVALRFLRNNKNGYDIVISDVHMPDMDGFKLLEHVGLEMDLPAIMMSVDDSKNVVMKGVTHGACDYLIKPVRMEALKNIWQHVVRKKKHGWKEMDLDNSGSVDDDPDSSANEGNWRNSKRIRKDEEMEERDDSSTLKKPRVVWSVELHQQFVTAVNHLGIDKAVPKKILELMNVPGLTRENVASHLQKYRLYLRRLSVPPHQNGLFPFGSIIDLQALAASGSGQLPPQSLPAIQATQLGQVTTKSVPLVDQRYIFNFDNQKSMQQQNSTAKQVNLLHGIPTNMDSKQLAALQRSAQSFGNMNLQVHSQSSQSNLLPMQMGQTHSVTDKSRSQVLDLPSSLGPAILPIPSAVLSHDGPASSVNIAEELSREFPGRSSCSSCVSNYSSSLTTKLHNEVNLQTKGSSAYLSHYFQDLCSKNIPSTCGFSEQGHLDVLPLPSVYQNNTSSVNNLLSKAERLPDIGFQNGLGLIDQEDLMSALLKHQKEDIGPVGAKLGFDGISLG